MLFFRLDSYLGLEQHFKKEKLEWDVAKFLVCQICLGVSINYNISPTGNHSLNCIGLSAVYKNVDGGP